MRVVTFGYQTWGHRTLQAVLAGGHEVPLAVTHPPSNNPYEQMWSDSVADLATAHGIPVYEARRPDEALINAVREAKPDVIVANNWRTWLPPEIYDAPPHGTLNVHDSLLPEYAGFSPVMWALLNRETHVGVTVHRMDETLDAGPIVAQQAVPVGPNDTTTDLFHATVALIEPLVTRALADLAAGTLTATAQDPARATYFHKRSEREAYLDFRACAADLELQVRAHSDPYPNAYFNYRGQRLRVLRAHVSRSRFGGTPGRVTVPYEGGVAVVCGSAQRNAPAPALILETLRLDDGREVAATEILGDGGYIDLP
ncbi:Polymyxin resistance protein PmrI [Dermatophilus congolensis]|uniref:Polymyxin resistance protein PmrI n=1 Tax=Dermatophilus congolensis TaxID=1863 RepID=A0A239V3Q6_9MICO|nr:methionyl-tRNA formyltransferase [Dermatophilus congolensis]SNV16702.1 Polymyxin resistance protein PmrI [Dermatophilus congolensis]